MRGTDKTNLGIVTSSSSWLFDNIKYRPSMVPISVFKTEEVHGDGVVGEQPFINPGESYTYSSGAVLKTEMGTMEGRYFMLSNNQDELEVAIPKFVLSVPRTLH